MVIAVVMSASDSAKTPIWPAWYSSASSALMVAPSTYPSLRGPTHPLTTMGLIALSCRWRMSPISAMAARFMPSSSSSVYPSRGAQSGFARQVGLSRTRPTRFARAIPAYCS
jgi:hypothetical protein